MVQQQRLKIEEELDVIEHNTQARTESEISGYWAERVIEYDTLTDYQLILAKEIVNNPPTKLEAVNPKEKLLPISA